MFIFKETGRENAFLKEIFIFTPISSFVKPLGMKINETYVLLVRLILVIACLNLLSCKHDAILSDNIPEICFEREVLPVYQNSCGMTGCHNGSGESGYSLTDYFGISHSVVAGKPYESPSYKAIIRRSGEGRMPPDRPVPLENRTIIRLWIEQGARLTSCLDTTSQPRNMLIPVPVFRVIFSLYWFQAVQLPVVMMLQHIKKDIFFRDTHQHLKQYHPEIRRGVNFMK